MEICRCRTKSQLLFLLAIFFLFLCCKSRDYDLNSTSESFSGRSLSPTVISQCFVNKNIHIDRTQTFDLVSKKNIYPTDKVVHQFIKGTVLFPQTDLALVILMLNDILLDPDIDFSLISDVKLSEAHSDLLAKAMTKFHIQHGILHVSPKFYKKQGAVSVDSERYAGLIQGGLHHAMMLMYSILLEAKNPYASKISLNNYLRSHDNLKNICDFVFLAQFLKRSLEDSKIKQLSDEWKQALKDIVSTEDNSDDKLAAMDKLRAKLTADFIGIMKKLWQLETTPPPFAKLEQFVSETLLVKVVP